MEKKEIKVRLETMYILGLVIVLLVGIIAIGLINMNKAEDKGDDVVNQNTNNEITGGSNEIGNENVQNNQISNENQMSNGEISKIINEMYRIAKKAYYMDFETGDSEEINDYGWKWEIKDYNDIVNTYFTSNGKKQLEQYYTSFTDIRKENGKIYEYAEYDTLILGSRFENEIKYIANVSVEADKRIEANMYLTDTITDKNESDIVLVKENDMWKIEKYNHTWDFEKVKPITLTGENYYIKHFEWVYPEDRWNEIVEIEKRNDNLYLNIKDINYIQSEMIYGLGNIDTNGEYLIEGINASEVKKAFVGFEVIGGADHTVCIIILTNEGELYYYSEVNRRNGADNGTKIVVEKLSITTNEIVDIYNFVERKMGRELAEIVVKDKNNNYYSLEGWYRSQGLLQGGY